MPRGRSKQPKSVETLTHEEARRRNLPSAEHQPLMREDEESPVQVRLRTAQPRSGSAARMARQGRAGLVGPCGQRAAAVHPGAGPPEGPDRRSGAPVPERSRADEYQTDMFADFNGLPSEDAKTEFYQHDANWSNRMILGDSLQVMASLAEREGLRGKVQCIYIDPPYGIKVQLQLPMVDHQPRRAGRQRRPHHPRAGAGKGFPRHLARWNPLLLDISA